jgi:hypothetical protein
MTRRASLDPGELVRAMLAAARERLGDHWADVKDYAETAVRNLVQTMRMIERLDREGRVTRRQARLLLEIQKNTARTVLLTIEGLGVLTAEQALDAALGAVKDAVNRTIGWRLL